MALQRQSGMALWRQIADDIRAGAFAGQDDGRLPTESRLAERYGVNRHTVRAALAALAREGLVHARRGHGTYVKARSRIMYPIGTRTRFSSAMTGNQMSGHSHVISSTIGGADDETRRLLALPAGASALRMDTVSIADGLPLSVSTHWFNAERFAAMPDLVRSGGSISRALAGCGVADYERMETGIEARHADDDELVHLRLAPGAVVLVTLAINREAGGGPIQRSITRFAAERTTLLVDHAGMAGSTN